jgi:hypothetical protein
MKKVRYLTGIAGLVPAAIAMAVPTAAHAGTPTGGQAGNATPLGKSISLHPVTGAPLRHCPTAWAR